VSTAEGIALAQSWLWRPVASAANAWRHISAAQIRYAILFWLGWALIMSLHMSMSYPAYAWWVPVVTGLYDAFVVAFLLLLCIAVADASAPRPWPWAPYVAAAFVASVLGTVVSVVTEPLVGIQCCWSGPRPSDAVFIGAGIGSNFVICSLAALIYYHRRRALRRIAALQRVQVRRAELARRAFEVRLQAMQARVEPQLLFNTLAQVERMYDTDAARGDRMLDDLIVYLRAALPQLRETASTVKQEVDLARAYFNVAKVPLGDRVALNVTVPRERYDARFPPMVLLPLIELAVEQRMAAPETRGSIDIDVRATGSSLRLAVTDQGARQPRQATSHPAPQGIGERLTALYGSAARLSFEHDGGAGLRAVIEIPCEYHDGGHR
jgi:hypothetical protein